MSESKVPNQRTEWRDVEEKRDKEEDVKKESRFKERKEQAA